MKKTIITLLIVFLISGIIYANFITGYFSIDSEKITRLGYKEYAIQYSLYDGRIFMYIILMIANLFNTNLTTLYIVLFVISLFIYSCSVLLLYNTINELKTEDRKIHKIIVFLLAYTYIFNFTTINNMEFIECIIMSASVILFIISAKKIVLKNKPIIGFVICLTGILCYQGTFNVFITTAIMFLALKKNEEQEKHYFIKKVVLIGLITLGVVILDIIVVKTLQAFIESSQGNRFELNIIENIKSLIKGIPMVVCDSLKLFPKFLQLIIITIITTLMYIYYIKNKKIKEFWMLILLIITCYLSCLALGITNSRLILETNGRMFNSTGALMSVILIYIYVKTDIFNKKYGTILKTIIFIYFIISLFNTFYITKILKTDNILEKQISFKIKEELEKNNINKVAIDYVIGVEGPGISKNKIVLCLYNTRIYKFYTGEELNKVWFDLDIRKEYFGDEKEKMIVVDDILYILFETDKYNYF